MDPRGTVNRIYKEGHYTLLHTKYESSGPCGFGDEDFFFYDFPIVSLWVLMTPGAGPFFTPGAWSWVAEFIKWTTRHLALGLVVSEKKICFYVFPFVSLGELSVAMETRVLIRPGQKPNAAFPHSSMMF